MATRCASTTLAARVWPVPSSPTWSAAACCGLLAGPGTTPWAPGRTRSADTAMPTCSPATAAPRGSGRDRPRRRRWSRSNAGPRRCRRCALSCRPWSSRVRPDASVRPQMSDPSLLDDLVAANRILADHGVLDAYGHISARDPARPDRYWLSRSMPPALVTAADLLAFDLDNNPVEGGNHKLFFERIIHGEIYQARADVMAVLHNHSPSLIPFCNSDTRLRPMVGNAAFLGEGAPVFDIRTVDDEGDLNVCTVAQARGLA